jgi:uncharacterized membrane protein
MDRAHTLTPFGRILYGIALVGLGVEHFVFGTFVVGRAPAWPPTIAGGRAWANVTGAIFIAIGLAILTRTKTREAAIVAALLVFAWGFVRHVPVLLRSDVLSGAWTQAGKSLVFIGGSLAVAAPSPRLAHGSRFVAVLNGERTFVLAGRTALGVFQIVSGVQHFLFIPFVASLIPAWFPGSAVFWAYAAGVALIVLGFGLLVPATARAAALLSGAMIFSWVWVVHLPRVFASRSDTIAVFEALGFSGLLFLMAGLLHERRSRATFAEVATA